MSTVIDGVLKEWGDRLFYVNVKARPAQKTACGFRRKKTVSKPARAASPAAAMAALKRTIKKTPEVMVKISGGGKSMSHIKAHMDYISRNGELPVQDETGHLIEGKEAIRDLRDDWKFTGGKAIPYEDGYRREAFNIVLSMPAGTNPESVRAAAGDFASAEFNGHQYIFALHTDKPQPHVHLCVKAMDNDMVRLNPRKADIQRWRETFAEKLREHGIEANATTRAVRGKSLRAEKQAVVNIDREFYEGAKKKNGEKKRTEPSRAAKGRIKEAQDEIAGVAQKVNPRQVAINKKRKEVIQACGRIATALANSIESDHQKTALEIVDFVRQMKPLTTAHDIEIAKQQALVKVDKPREVARDEKTKGDPGRER